MEEELDFVAIPAEELMSQLCPNFPTVTISELDNAQSYLLKTAYLLGVPVQYLGLSYEGKPIIISDIEGILNKLVITDLLSEVIRLIDMELSPTDAYAEIRPDIYPFLDEPAVAFAFLYSRVKPDVDFEDLRLFLVQHERYQSESLAPLKALFSATYMVYIERLKTVCSAVKKVIKIQEAFSQPRYQYSNEVTVEKNTITGSVTYLGEVLTPERGFEFFIKQSATLNVPTIIYKNNRGLLYTRYQGRVPNVRKIQENELHLWTKIGKFEIDLTTSTLTMILSGADYQPILTELNLELTNRQESSRLAHATIYLDQEFIPAYWLHRILVQRPYNEIFYVEEATNPVAAKSHLALTYRFNLEGFDFIPTFSTVGHLESSILHTPIKVNGQSYPEGNPILTVVFSQVRKEAEIRYYLTLLAYALASHQANLKAYINLYRGYIKPRAKSKNEPTKVKALQSVGLEIFSADKKYARTCQNEKQPTVVPRELITDEGNGKLTYKGKDVIPYPNLTSPSIYLSCQNPLYPLFNLVRTEGVDLAPCCAVDEKSPSRKTALQYLDGVPLENIRHAEPRSSNRIIVTAKAVRSGQSGALHSVILNNYFARLFATPPTVIRHGSNGDLISAVQMALESTVTPMLSFPALLKQENWELSESEIMAWFIDPKRPLTYERFFRVLEETYMINLYLVDDKEFIFGRYRYFQARPFRPRPAILLYLHPNGNYEYLSFNGIARLLEDPFYDTTRVLRRFDALDPAFNPEFDYYDSLEQVLGPAQAQFIDESGKVRALQYPDFSLLTPPFQPLNLPSVIVDQLVKTTELERWRTYQVGTAVEGLVLNINNTIYYLPTAEPQSPDQLFPMLLRQPVSDASSSDLRYLERMNSDILNLILWLFVLSGRTFEVFFDEEIIIGTEINAPYQTNKLDYYLPELDYWDALNYLEGTGLIRDDHIYLYNQRYADGIRYYLKLYQQTRVPKLPKVLSGRFLEAEDFPRLPGEEVVIGELSAAVVLTPDFMVHSNVDDSYLSRRLPYFISPTLLVQNVNTGTREQALSLAQIWNRDGYNPGYESPMEEVTIAVQTYQVNKVPEFNEKAALFRYSNGVYATILGV